MITPSKCTILFTVLLLTCTTAFAQIKKLLKPFKLGTVGYNLYTLESKPNQTLNDTSFYLLYRVGNTKIIAKEIKEIKVKSSGKILLAATYATFPKAIIFMQQGDSKQDDHRKYTQNNKGLLSFNKYSASSIIAVQEPKIAEFVTDNTRNPGVVDAIAQFPGGMNAARSFIARNLIYPDIAVENNVQGTVYVTFLIAKDGSITNIKINQGIGSGCDEEVIRVIKKMPKWIPAKLKGNHVASQMRLPVSFKLSDE